MRVTLVIGTRPQIRKSAPIVNWDEACSEVDPYKAASIGQCASQSIVEG